MQLSPQNEQFINQVVADGFFPNQDAALDAAIAALREKTAQIPFLEEEYVEAAKEGLRESQAGLSRIMTEEDRRRLQDRITAIANTTSRQTEAP